MMTKSQIVAHLAEKAGIPKKTAAALIEELATLATKQTKSGGQFVIPGLGKAVRRTVRPEWDEIRGRAKPSRSPPERL